MKSGCPEAGGKRESRGRALRFGFSQQSARFIAPHTGQPVHVWPAIGLPQRRHVYTLRCRLCVFVALAPEAPAAPAAGGAAAAPSSRGAVSAAAAAAAAGRVEEELEEHGRLADVLLERLL